MKVTDEMKSAASSLLENAAWQLLIDELHAAATNQVIAAEPDAHNERLMAAAKLRVLYELGNGARQLAGHFDQANDANDTDAKNVA